LARIKAVMRAARPTHRRRGGDRWPAARSIAHRVSAAGTQLALGPTEFRMLHFFMTHPERVYSRAQLLDEIWGDHVFVEERPSTFTSVDCGRRWSPRSWIHW